ncbi:MAG: hypothetical protein UX65_C0003G0048 [Parcubacteria group bacterium GW2011_GWB1_46_8]|nr:MAG: hypothetical protein UX65_C0003G0048 [Parcubacteria group bacterium GW2011_GWB1_46_8]
MRVNHAPANTIAKPHNGHHIRKETNSVVLCLVNEEIKRTAQFKHPAHKTIGSNKRF